MALLASPNWNILITRQILDCDKSLNSYFKMPEGPIEDSKDEMPALSQFVLLPNKICGTTNGCGLSMVSDISEMPKL
jgi:hypothetical protein